MSDVGHGSEPPTPAPMGEADESPTGSASFGITDVVVYSSAAPTNDCRSGGGSLHDPQRCVMSRLFP